MLKPGDALSRLLVGTTAKLDRNMFCFILSNSFTHTHAQSTTQTYTQRPHSDTCTQGDFSALLLKALTVSLTCLWKAIELLGNLSSFCRMDEVGSFQSAEKIMEEWPRAH